MQNGRPAKKTKYTKCLADAKHTVSKNTDVCVMCVHVRIHATRALLLSPDCLQTDQDCLHHLHHHKHTRPYFVLHRFPFHPKAPMATRVWRNLQMSPLHESAKGTLWLDAAEYTSYRTTPPHRQQNHPDYRSPGKDGKSGLSASVEALPPSDCGNVCECVFLSMT